MVVIVDLQSTVFTFFYFQILSPYFWQFILGFARPVVQAVCLSLCFSLHLPSGAPHSTPASSVEPISVSSDYCTYVPLQHSPCKRKGQQGYFGPPEAQDIDKWCPALLKASKVYGSRWHAGLAKMQIACGQLEQGCPFSLPPGMSLSGGQEKCVIWSTKRGLGWLLCGSRLNTVTRPISNCILCMFWCAWLLS